MSWLSPWRNPDGRLDYASTCGTVGGAAGLIAYYAIVGLNDSDPFGQQLGDIANQFILIGVGSLAGYLVGSAINRFTRADRADREPAGPRQHDK